MRSSEPPTRSEMTIANRPESKRETSATTSSWRNWGTSAVRKRADEITTFAQRCAPAGLSMV